MLEEMEGFGVYVIEIIDNGFKLILELMYMLLGLVFKDVIILINGW